jgi:hypothetical protein
MYTLMNKDTKLADFDILGESDMEYCEIRTQYGEFPIWVGKDISGWINNRSAAKHRKHISKILEQCGGETLSGFIAITHCLSLNDTLWVRSDREAVSWKDVSLYQNEFNDVVSKLSFDGNGLYGIQMSTTSPELTTDGSFDKCWTKDSGDVILIKTGSSGASNAGLEPYCEVLASQVFERICSGVKYDLGKFSGKVVSKCRMFTSEKYGYKPMSLYCNGNNTLPWLLKEYERFGCDEIFRRMLVADAVTINNDRHLGNFGFIVDNDTFERVTINPVFDYNMAFFPYADWYEGFDDMETWIANRGPRIGSNYYTVAKNVMTSSIRSDLINLKDLTLEVETDDKFTKERLQIVNRFKNAQIDKILGVSDVKFYFEDLKNSADKKLAMLKAAYAGADIK